MGSKDSQALLGSVNLVRQNLAIMLGLPKNFARQAVIGEKVDLSILIDYFMQRKEQVLIDVGRHRLAILLLFADLMLVNPGPLIHFGIVNVMKGFYDGTSHVPIILCPRCPRCKEEIESIEHVIFWCHYAKQVWSFLSDVVCIRASIWFPSLNGLMKLLMRIVVNWRSQSRLLG